MIDEVQKIREEVEKLHGNPYYMMAVKDVLAIIDSLQKEPVSSIWHDASEEPEEGKQLVFSYKKQYYAGRIYKDEFGRTLAYDGKTAIELGLLDNWAYLDDLLKLDNPCKIGKNLQEEPKIPQVFDEGYWERLGEEPVSKEIGDYDHKAVMESLHPELKKEPVSEDLEDAAYKFVMDNFGNPKEPLYKFDQRCFKAGANWQRQKDEHLIWQTSTANYEKGIEEGKQQMMKDAVVAAVNTYEEIGGEGYVEFVANIPVGQYRKEMLVKLIIIKEE